MRKIILVTGATGAQGGSIANALLQNKKFTIRILTRNVQSDSAKALQQAGAEIAAGDFDNIESLQQALKDVYGVFGVTNFWEHFGKEYQQGKNLIDAVKQAGIQHFVYSSLPDYNKLSGGRLPVPHCDMKAALKEYTKEMQLPATFVEIAFYYENFFSFFQLQKDEHDRFYFGFPQGDTKLSMVSVEDFGTVVASIFDHPQEYMGRTVGVVGEDLTCAEYAQIFSKVLERDVYFNYIPRDTYAAFGFSGAEELANMFEVQRLYIPQRQLDLIESYGLNPSMQRFESWVRKNKGAFMNRIDEQLRMVAG
ncbi:NmrA/HSCARG family protein [Pseudoflavitalea sp. X16]|uniref:NmrA/HSCARG family protein n=1 Tax=Paraflavitalea devenefica TaxID=2716334 RepID=UPI0014245482|nr:NmrA/HSCARG family protein [Paraflavitalea devenefica]NII27192.1 NmrA/HSCARG family protein [Paraflavitalea devenefica]